MKYFKLTLIILTIHVEGFCQTTGPVYEFNFNNTPKAQVSQGLAETSSMITSPESDKKNTYLLRNSLSSSLLNPEDNFIGIVAQYIAGIKNRGGEVQYINSEYLLGVIGSLSSVKYKSEELDKTTTWKFGLLKQIRINNHFAFEGILSYSKTKINYSKELVAAIENGPNENRGVCDIANFLNYCPNRDRYNPPSLEDLPVDKQSADVSLGIKFYAGNFVGGISAEKPVYDFDKTNTQTAIDRPAATSNLKINAKLGVYF